MWIVAGTLLLAALFALAVVQKRKEVADALSSSHTRAAGQRGGGRSSDLNSASILSKAAVEHSIASGAPPTPWFLWREDQEAMNVLSAYFARAIPTPTSDGRVSVVESIGHGGPQLELYVPVLSSRSPVAVLARCWNRETETLEARLFFFGAVNGRLNGIVGKLGFVRHGEPRPDRTVFVNRRRFARKRAS